MFSSTLLASCGEAMTERCGLAAEFYSVGSTTGDLCLFCSVLSISHLNRNSQTCDAKLPKPMNVVRNFKFFKRTRVASCTEENPRAIALSSHLKFLTLLKSLYLITQTYYHSWQRI
ncbi:hypothetical protein [Nostoc sp.]|uniref:hypothetical protein n=1 Tax=Nostoc sp. TaxID=1180 RepID=UPI002FF9E2FC